MSIDIPGMRETISKAYDRAMAKGREEEKRRRKKDAAIGARAAWYIREAKRKGLSMTPIMATMNAAYDFATGEHPPGAPPFPKETPGTNPTPERNGRKPRPGTPEIDCRNADGHDLTEKEILRCSLEDPSFGAKNMSASRGRVSVRTALDGGSGECKSGMGRKTGPHGQMQACDSDGRYAEGSTGNTATDIGPARSGTRDNFANPDSNSKKYATTENGSSSESIDNSADIESYMDELPGMEGIPYLRWNPKTKKMEGLDCSGAVAEAMRRAKLPWKRTSAKGLESNPYLTKVGDGDTKMGDLKKGDFIQIKFPDSWHVVIYNPRNSKNSQATGTKVPGADIMHASPGAKRFGPGVLRYVVNSQRGKVTGIFRYNRSKPPPLRESRHP
ncbi:MAG: C40 family peptidase [Magnetococcales bacterium]|nr:C40 family peptidase [Magnetococcales bacterium]